MSTRAYLEVSTVQWGPNWHNFVISYRIFKISSSIEILRGFWWVLKAFKGVFEGSWKIWGVLRVLIWFWVVKIFYGKENHSKPPYDSFKHIMTSKNPSGSFKNPLRSIKTTHDPLKLFRNPQNTSSPLKLLRSPQNSIRNSQNPVLREFEWVSRVSEGF